MKPFADHLAVYAASHRHPHNRLTHYVGVPTIIFAMMVLLRSCSQTGSASRC